MLAIITGGDDKESRYFQRSMCVDELKWAIEGGVKIVPVVTAADKLKVGDVKEGTVATVQDFGVFVELGGVQGLLHKSELGQGADVTLPAVGDTVTVRVKSIDRAKERISLGLKDEPTGPWATVGTDFVEGDSYTGTVSRIMDFGAFVKLAEGLEGLAGGAGHFTGHVGYF